MRSSVLWRKQSRIIMMLAKSLHIDAERALNLFYTTKVYQHLGDTIGQRETQRRISRKT